MEENSHTNEFIDDRYKIVETAGVGGMAIVYKAHDLITNKYVAIKMMKKETSADRMNLIRFEREARASASLNHPNIVKVINVGTYQGLPYIVNEFIYGKNLNAILSTRGHFSQIEALDIMSQLCLAVNYAHSHGVIHHDLKPQNIFLTKDHFIKLSDFGIACFLSENNTAGGDKFMGTVFYSAPELFNERPASVQTDIYALGITFFELVTGKVPFDGKSAQEIYYQHLHKKCPSLKKYNPKLSPAIEKIIFKAVSKKPTDRYKSCKDMYDDIKALLDDPKKLNVQDSFFPHFLSSFKEKIAKKRHKDNLIKAAKENKDER